MGAGTAMKDLPSFRRGNQTDPGHRSLPERSGNGLFYTEIMEIKG